MYDMYAINHQTENACQVFGECGGKSTWGKWTFKEDVFPIREGTIHAHVRLRQWAKYRTQTLVMGLVYLPDQNRVV